MLTIGDFKLHRFIRLKIFSGSGSPLLLARYVLAVVLECVGATVEITKITRVPENGTPSSEAYSGGAKQFL
eukprot:symbB.v1.2.030208.t1/scaffold3381.1/size58006/3